MKKGLAFMIASLLFVGVCYGNINWVNDYNVAVEQAQASQKPMLLFFTGTDWCKWCNKLEDEVFNTGEFAVASGDQFVFVKLDFPMYSTQDPSITQKNKQLQKKYNVRNFPQVILLDPDQQQIGITGYRAGGGKSYAQHLLKIVNDYFEYNGKMRQLGKAEYSGKDLKKMYQKANEFGLDEDASRLIAAGINSDQRHFFLTERYRHLAEVGKVGGDEAVKVREELLAADPENKNLTHYQIAVIDFDAYSQKMASENLQPEIIVAPLLNYIWKFGDQDKENLWRLNLIVAQVYQNHHREPAALQYAKSSYQQAPEGFKEDIAKLIASIEGKKK